MRDMMQAADLCLVPIRPSEADVRATMPTLRALAESGRPYSLVVSQAPARVRNMKHRLVMGAFRQRVRSEAGESTGGFGVIEADDGSRGEYVGLWGATRRRCPRPTESTAEDISA